MGAILGDRILNLVFAGSECDLLLTLAPVSSPVKGASSLDLRKIGFVHRPTSGLEPVRMCGGKDKIMG